MDNPLANYDKSLLKLKSCSFLNTYKRVNWDTVIAELTVRTGSAVTTDPSRWNTETPGYQEIYSLWKTANFNPASIKWVNYYPEVDYSQEIVDEVADYLRVKVHRSWISRLDSGFIAPWHWDVDDHESQYLAKGTPVRYSIIMNPPTLGNIFIVGDDYIYNSPQGSIFKWHNYKEWHSGINAGMTPSFMFHLLAYS